MSYKDKEKERVYRITYYKKNKERQCKYQKEYRQKHLEKCREKDKEYRQKHLEKCRENDKRSYSKPHRRVNKSLYRKCNYDFSPIQQGYLELSRSEMTVFLDKRIAAVPLARTTNRYSKRKGVSWDEKRNLWVAYLGINGKRYLKYFKTKQEAIQYRIELENKYYSPEQLKIRDKYS